MLGCEADEGVVNWLVDKSVDQSVGARCDGTAGELARQDMDNRELFAVLRGFDDCCERGFVDGFPRQSDLRAVVIDDLDIVRSLGDPRGHERVGLVRRGDRWDGKPVFCAVAARCRHERAGRAKVGAAGCVARDFLCLLAGRE